MELKKLLVIDTRVEDYNVFISSRQEGVLYVTYDYNNDTYASLTERIVSELNGSGIESVALVSHAVINRNFKLLEQEEESILPSVQLFDPQLNTWSGFRNFWSCIGATTIDLLGCALYIDDNWRYVLDTLEKQMGVNFRASIDDTGALAVGANWVLESDNVNVEDIYFTSAIENWTGILGSSIPALSAYVDNSGYLYTWGNPVANGRGSCVPTLINPSERQSTLSTKQLQKIAVAGTSTPGSICIIVSPCGTQFTNTNGELWVIGSGTNNMLGTGNTNSVTVPTQISAGGTSTGWMDIAFGSSHTVGLKNGAVWCWGANASTSRQCADWSGAATARTVPTQPRDPSGVIYSSLSSGVIAVASCALASAALKSDGSIWTWGNNGFGQCGVGNTISPQQPSRIFSSGATAISGNGTCFSAIVNGALWSWGTLSGQSGTGTTGIFSSPVQPLDQTTGLPIFTSGSTSVTCGVVSTFVVNNGILYAAGDSTSGRLGTGDSTGGAITYFKPCIDSSGNIIRNPLSIAAGNIFTIIVDSSGGLMTTGSNTGGRLGQNVSPLSFTTRFDYCYDSLPAGNQIRSGYTKVFNTASFAPTSAGIAYMMRGNDLYGMGLLDAAPSVLLTHYLTTTANQYKIGLVQSFIEMNKRVHAVSVGGSTSWGSVMAVITTQGLDSSLNQTNGELWMIGSIAQGGLGNGENSSGTVRYYGWFIQPRDASGNIVLNSGVTAVSCGTNFTGVVCNGRVYMFGVNNLGYLGDGTTTARANPVEPVDASGSSTVKFTSGVTAVSCGDTNTAVIVNGALWAWGANNAGQLGTRNNTNSSNFPVQPRDSGNNPTLTSGVSVVSVGYSAMSVVVNGGAQITGSNNYVSTMTGLLGNGNLIDTSRNFFAPIKNSIGNDTLQSGVSNVITTGSNTYILENSGVLWGCGFGQITNGLPGYTTQIPYAVDLSGYKTTGSVSKFTAYGGSASTVNVIQNGALRGFGSSGSGINFQSTFNSGESSTGIAINTPSTVSRLWNEDPTFVNVKIPVLVGTPTVSVAASGSTLSQLTITGTFVDPSDNVTSVPGTITFNSPSTVAVSGQSYTWTFRPTSTSVYGNVSGSSTVTIIVFPVLSGSISVSGITFGQTISSAEISGSFIDPNTSAAVSGSITFDNPSTKPSVGTTSYPWTFRPDASSSYLDVSGNQTVVTSKATPLQSGVSVSVSGIAFGQDISSAGITYSGNFTNPNDSSVVSGSITFDDPSTKPNVGTASYGWTFIPDASNNYNNITGNTVSITTVKTTPDLSGSLLVSSIAYGQILHSADLSGTFINPYSLVTVSGTLQFDASSSTPNIGTTSYAWTFRPSDSTNYNDNSGTANVSVDYATTDSGIIGIINDTIADTSAVSLDISVNEAVFNITPYTLSSLFLDPSNQTMDSTVYTTDFVHTFTAPQIPHYIQKVSSPYSNVGYDIELIDISSGYNVIISPIPTPYVISPDPSLNALFVFTYKVVDTATGQFITDLSNAMNALINLGSAYNPNLDYIVYHVDTATSITTPLVNSVANGIINFQITKNNMIIGLSTLPERNPTITLPFVFDLSAQSILLFGEDVSIPDASFNLTVDMSASIFRQSFYYRDMDACGNIDISFVPLSGNLEYEINRLNGTTADVYNLTLAEVHGSNYVDYTQFSRSQNHIVPLDAPLNGHFIQYISSLMFGHPQAQAPIKNDANIISDLSNDNLGNQFVQTMLDMSGVRHSMLEQLIAADISGDRFDLSDNDGNYHPYPFLEGDKITFRVAMQGNLFVDSETELNNGTISNTNVLYNLFDGIPGISLVPVPKFDSRMWKVVITLV